ncbi:MAG: hypothetical protein ACLTC0_07430 [Eisenbergiella massiliensis]|uniref:hypothetical protein n=1 Tax=Eisenbergiella massiliensis TaxID=1720294 RepID=UPI0039934E1D
MEKRISVGEPFVNCYSKFGAITSILDTDSNARVWGYHNYLILMYMRGENNKLFWMDLRSDIKTIWEPEWKICPFLEGYQIETSKIAEHSTFVNFIKEKVDNGFCIYLDLCVDYISAYNVKCDRQHDLLILGYNQERHYAICRDYFGTKYVERNIPFDELENSFNIKLMSEERKDYNFLLKLKSNKLTVTDYKLYISKLLEPVKFFSVEPGTDNNFQFIFGIETYKYLFDDYRKKNLDLSDLRPIYVIKNHILLLMRLSEFYQSPFNELLSEIYEIIKIICNYTIKYKVTEKHTILEKIISLSELLYRKEKEYLSNILVINEKYLDMQLK